jgi:hypothetical protein
MHRRLWLFQVGNQLLDPLLREWIKSLLQKSAIVQDLLLEFVALLAHGSPLETGGSVQHSQSLKTPATVDDDDNYNSGTSRRRLQCGTRSTGAVFFMA